MAKFKRILITGGAGFIGSNFVKYILGKYPDYHVIVLDALTYAGNLENLKSEMENPHFEFYHGDIRNREVVNNLMWNSEAIVHFAAETHVDRSILDADAFITTDIYGTYVLLEAARAFGTKKFVHISTDEVYGEAVSRPSKEEDAFNPKSPYAASKAGADRLAYSYFATYGIPVVISRCCNNYGPYQYPEKLIPLFISNALEDKPLPAYGTGKNTRQWIHVLDHCKAIDLLLHSQDKCHGGAYNISSEEEFSIIDIGNTILENLGKPKSLLTPVKDRHGHVLRHAMDPTKMRETFNWKTEIGFKAGIKETINWYKENQDWWKKTKEKSRDYQEFYRKWYSER